LLWLASGVALAGMVQAQDKSASFNQLIQTNSNVKFSLDVKSEPTIQLGSHSQLSGLFVDLSDPPQTWAMLNPPTPVKDPQTVLPPCLLPLQVPRSPSDPAAVHGADFILLRLSFP